jgi:hypothetical protein
MGEAVAVNRLDTGTHEGGTAYLGKDILGSVAGVTDGYGVTGLYDYGYRDYMPAAARFTTEDPVRDGANWFAYVNNDPVNHIDLRGLEPIECS